MGLGSPEAQGMNGRGGDASRESHFLFGAPDAQAKAAGQRLSTESMLLGAGGLDKMRGAPKEGMGAMLADPAELPGVGDGKKGIFSTASTTIEGPKLPSDTSYNPASRLNQPPGETTVSDHSRDIAADRIVAAAGGETPLQVARQQSNDAPVVEQKKTA